MSEPLAKLRPADLAPQIATVAPGNKTSGRIVAIDFTKGALVVTMVLYHWLNYFIGLQSFFYRYLRFLPPSFIFITGFLISQVYLSRRDARSSWRLLQRGLKLFAIFVSLNVAMNLFLPSYSSGLSGIMVAAVTGNNAGSPKAASFSILAPISYLLLVSAVLLPAQRVFKHIFHVMCAGFLVSVIVLNVNRISSANLELLTIGLLGASVGHLPIGKINSIVRHPYAVLAAYLCYTAVITIWNVAYLYFFQIVGVCLTLMVMYLVGSGSGGSRGVREAILLLGKYSLFGYIAQIAVLKLLRRVLDVNLGAGVLWMALIAALVLTLLIVEAVDRARARSSVLERAYVAVFS